MKTAGPKAIEVELSPQFPTPSRPLRHDCQAMGARLRRLRQERGLRLSELARTLRVTPACVCQWEGGKSYPKPHFWSELSRALGTSVSFLMTGEEVPLPASARLPENVIERARKEIARALGLDTSKVRIEVDDRVPAGVD